MPRTVATTTQTYWKNCWAPSSQVNLTLMSNGEEQVKVFTTNYQLFPASIPTPTVAATMADGGISGGLPAGNYVYLYVYASSAYPSVEADTTAGGNEWPKGQPSPVSLVYMNTANHKINVTVGTSQRADIDKILIYRNLDPDITDLTYVQIVEQAGQVFYVGFVENNPAVATVTFTDSVTALQEELEVDNFGAPQFWKCVYIDPYWYGIGNPDLAVPVTIDASGNLTATTNAFFSGRNGQLVTFDGINVGGFDGFGTFYYLYNTLTVCYVSVSADLSSQDFPGYVGTTTMRVRGFAGTLYRSKARNPFAWGYTQYQQAGDSQVRVTQQFAQEVGGYGVAIATLPVNRQLKLDMERPARCYAIDVSVPLESNFQQATRLLDSRYIVTAHDSQFPCLVAGSGTALRGWDTSNFAIVQSDSNDQAPISDEVFQTLRTAVTTNNYGRQFHGVFDPNTELSAFWFKQSIDPDNLITIDSCLLYHGPTGQWSFLRDLDVTASLSVYDPVQLQELTLIGTASGAIAQAFDKSTFQNLIGTLDPMGNTAFIQGFTVIPDGQAFIFQCVGNAVNAEYFDLYSTPTQIDRWYVHIVGQPDLPPSSVGVNRVLKITLNSSVGLTYQNDVVASFNADSFYSAFAGPKQPVPNFPNFSDFFVTVRVTGTLTTLPTFVMHGGHVFNITFQFNPYTTGGYNLQIANTGFTGGVIGTWCLVTTPDGTGEAWARIGPASSVPFSQIAVDLWFDPLTLAVSTTPPRLANVGDIVSVGLIDCEAQTYFQPSDTISGQRVELWSTQENTGTFPDTFNFGVNINDQSIRLYSQFSTTEYGSPFQLVQLPLDDKTTPSENWTTSNKVPTTLVPQFGIRFIERGYEDFTMMSFTLLGKGS